MSLKSRKDNRTTEEFAADLKRYAKEEAIIAEAIRLHLEEVNSSKCSIIDIGIDSSGSLISGNLQHNNVDRLFKLENGKSIKVEIKTAPIDYFFTFKVSSLKAAIKQDACIIIFCKSKKDRFFLLTKPQIETIIKHKPPKIYKNFSPNDQSIRIFIEEFPIFFTEKKWAERAAKCIKTC